MILSINPTYFCNFRCNFCYLTESQLSDQLLLPLDRLNDMLSQIPEKIDMVDIYGGEVGLLPHEYWNDMINLLNSYGINDINLITNLSMINNIVKDERVYTSVSYDFEAREKHEVVWKNMALLNKPFSVLMLASKELMNKDVNEMVSLFNSLSKLQSVEIKPYSSNQANQHELLYTEYEDFVKKWIENDNKEFIFVNEDHIKSVLNKTKNSFSDDHVYITPHGKFGVLEFDLNDNEYFLEYDTIDQYYDWCKKEKVRVSKNKYCNSCKHYGHCLSEHLREVKSIEHSCNGFIKLIDWYDTSRNI